MGAKKNFILDTNVVLHDFKAIYNFEENDIYLPMVVLEELDKFKKGNDQINFNARQFARELDEVVENKDFVTNASVFGCIIFTDAIHRIITAIQSIIIF